MDRLHHLCPKTVPWLQGARPLDVTCRVRCLCGKKEAAKKSLGLKKALTCSLHQPGKTASLHQHVKNLQEQAP